MFQFGNRPYGRVAGIDHLDAMVTGRFTETDIFVRANDVGPVPTGRGPLVGACSQARFDYGSDLIDTFRSD